MGPMDAPDPQPNPPTLAYAAPPIYLRGEYRCRNATSIVAIPIVTLLGLAGLWLALGASFTSNKAADQSIRGLIAALGTAFLGMAAYGTWLVCTDRKWEVLITDDGITRKGRLLPWQSIARLGAALSSRHVVLYYELRHARRKPAVQRSIELTPLLTVDEYRTLARKLSAHLPQRHPHLTIDLEPTQFGG